MRWGCPLRRSPHGWGSSLPPCEPPCSASTGKFMWRIAASFWNSWAPRHEMCSWRKSSGEGEGFSGVAVHDSPTDRRVVVTIPCERVRVTSAAGLCAVALLCVGTLPIGLSATRWGTAPRVPRRARVHAVSREPDLLGDGTRRLAGVAQQRSPGPGGGLCRARAGQPPGPLPVLCAQHDHRLRPRQTVPPVLALRQREHVTAAVQLLHGYYTTSWWPGRASPSPMASIRAWALPLPVALGL